MSTILIINDSQLRGKMSLLLREAGQQVDACDNGHDALKRAASKRYEVAIVDPGIADIAYLDFITKLTIEVPDLIVGGLVPDGDEAVAKALSGAGVKEAIPLPLQVRQTMEQLERLDEAAQLVRKKRSSVSQSTKSKKAEPTTRGFVRLGSSEGSRTSASLPGKNGVVSAGGRSGGLKSKPVTRPPISEQRYTPHFLAHASESSKRLIRNIHIASSFERLIIIEAERGTEFEQIAREIHHCAKNDDYITLLPHEDINAETLASLEAIKWSRMATQPGIVFIEHVEEISHDARSALVDFWETQDRHHSPRIRFILSTASNSLYHNHDTHAWVSTLKTFAEFEFKLSPLHERREDIEPLARMLLSSITMIHPEYPPREFEKQAVDFLRQQLWRENFDGLRNVILKTCQCCTSPAISVGHLQAHMVEEDDMSADIGVESEADDALSQVFF